MREIGCGDEREGVLRRTPLSDVAVAYGFEIVTSVCAGNDRHHALVETSNACFALTISSAL
jgi:hypothetical protein